MTEKLYYRDPYLFSFDARVTRVSSAPQGWAVVLDRTCFYPGGGGQPADRGKLSGVPVTGLREEGDEIVHLLAAPLPEGPVRGEVDAERRRDFMVQHTGQHILSRSLLTHGGHETVSVHFGEETTDVEVRSVEIPEADLSAAEQTANRAIRENRRVLVHETDAAGVSRFPLRRPPPSGPERLRVVEVEGFDWAACGGVHVASAGEVFLVKVLSTERIRGRLRIHAVMGERAFADYGRKAALARELSLLFTCGEGDIALRAAELLRREREQARELGRLRARAAAAEAAGAVAAAERVGGLLFVPRLLEGAGADAVAAFMDAALSGPGRLCVVVDRSGDGFRWAVGIPEGDPTDLSGLVTPILAAFPARGGGRGGRIQGSAKDSGRAQEFIDAVRAAAARRA